MAELTLAQAAEILGMKKQGLDYHRKAGHITARKMGRFYMVDPEVAEKELQSHIYRSHYKKDQNEDNEIELATVTATDSEREESHAASDSKTEEQSPQKGDKQEEDNIASSAE